MGKLLISTILLLGLISCSFGYTVYPIGAPGATMTFDTVIGQSSLTSSSNSMLRTPADLVYNTRGGLYVSDVNGNNGGRIFYYSNPASNNPDLVLGAADFNQTLGQLGNPSGLGLYSTATRDNYLAVGTRGNGFSKFYNLTAGNNQNTPGVDYVSTLGVTPIEATSTQFLSLTVNPNNGALYVADTGNNRVAVLPSNSTSTSLPLFYYGAGPDGTAATCNSSGATCFTNPSGVAIDCNQGVWISVTGVGSNVGVGVLYFPAGSRVATALYQPNVTADFTPGYIFGIDFNAGCTRIALSGTYRVYVGSVSLTTIPVISNLVSLGLYTSTQNIPQATASSDSLTTVQNTAWDPLNPNRLAIADQNHNRVVIGNVPGATSPSSGASNSIGFSTVPSASNFTLPSASNITVPSASASVSRAANSSISASQSGFNFTLPSASNLTLPSASNFTLPSASNVTVPSASASTSRAANSSLSASASFLNITITSPSNSPSSSLVFANFSNTPAPASLSQTSSVSLTSTISSSSVPSFTSNPSNNSESSQSESESQSSSPFPSFTYTGSAASIQSWVDLF